ncbi:malonyl-CoA decarboxylase [Rhizobiaceae bacterium]|nr:malonyl-CoA decarboxylase [Rhizobiaceae bacterium]
MNQQRTMLEAVLNTIVGSRRRAGSGVDSRLIEDEVRALLKLGPDAGKRVANAILTQYAGLNDEKRLSFFQFLARVLDIDPARVAQLATAYGESHDPAIFGELQHAVEPPRQNLLRRLNAQPGATVELVNMRADLLAAMKSGNDTNELQRVDMDFAHLFASWFNRGFLKLERISWDTSASVLAKIIAYEAVHQINGWGDLRLRLQPADRRCYAFFHPAIPGEPLVFTELALVRGIPSSVQRVLDEDRAELPAEKADTAVFYSISNCQTGLRGVSFGNLLIKQVVADLARELPGLKRFVTLSPLPGLAAWLKRDGLHGDALTAAAAHYLTNEKRGDGQALDPVARFHLANGAQIEAVHADADTSDNGMAQSHGVMVNYLYDLSQVEANQEAYATERKVAASRATRKWAAAYRS